jgi:hypothetical protein
MQTECTDTGEALPGRFQALCSQSDELQRRLGVVREQLAALHAEHEGLLAESWRLGAEGAGWEDRACQVLEQAHVLLQAETKLLRECQHLHHQQWALWEERTHVAGTAPGQARSQRAPTGQDQAAKQPADNEHTVNH